MSEDPKPYSPIEKKRSSRRERVVAVPEWWRERPAHALSKEYMGFELEVARVIAQKTGLSLTEAGKQFTSYIRASVLYDGGKVFEGTSDSTEIVGRLHRNLSRLNRTDGGEYHPRESNQYGCFSYEYVPTLKMVRIHFQNRESDEEGPLTSEKIERRQKELHDLFTAVKRNHPEVDTVVGGSWLYNLEAYRRLFPESYLSAPEGDPSTRSLTIGYGVYGQFLDDQLELKRDLAKWFLTSLKSLDHIDVESVQSVLPYKLLRVEGPVEDFYEKYGVS